MRAPVPPLAETPTSAIARGRSNARTDGAISVDDAEARQRESFGRMILVHDLDPLPDVVDVLGQAVAHQRRGDKRPFVELDQRIDVGHLVLEGGMERQVVTVEGENLAAAGRRRPFHVGGERLVRMVLAIGLRPIGGAAGLAAPDQELVLLEALVEVLVVLVDVGKRLLPGLVADNDVRFAAHGCLPSKVPVWIEHMPGEISSPPCPVVIATLQSLICRSPASPRTWRIASAMPV